jgi:hypothetical protein
MKTQITHLTIEELTDAAKATPEPVSIECEHEDIKNFISALRLRKGSKRVPFGFLYQVYKLWSLKPTRKSRLGNELSKKFNKSRNRYETFYHLSNFYLIKNPRNLEFEK